MSTWICVIISNGGLTNFQFFLIRHHILHGTDVPTQQPPAINKNNRSSSKKKKKKVKPRLSAANSLHLLMLYRHGHRRRNAVASFRVPFIPVNPVKGDNCNWSGDGCSGGGSGVWVISASPYVSCQPHAPVSFSARSQAQEHSRSSA